MRSIQILAATIVAAFAFSATPSHAAKEKTKFVTIKKYKERFGLPPQIANDDDKPIVKPMGNQRSASADSDSAWITEFTQEADFFESPATPQTFKETD
jgi:hypothetical protein